MISPLISLMEDQCHHMKQLGIEAAYLCADTPKVQHSIIIALHVRYGCAFPLA